jgi:hypothetical protein
LDKHTSSDTLLHVILQPKAGNTLQLTTGLTVHDSSGPVVISGQDQQPGGITSSNSSSSSSRVVLDGSKIKPSTSAVAVYSSASVTLQNLVVTGCRRAPAVVSRAGRLTLVNMVFSNDKNTADGEDPYAHGIASCLNCQGLIVIRSKFYSNVAVSLTLIRQTTDGSLHLLPYTCSCGNAGVALSSE